jgi:hypothetical protein
MMTKIYKRNKTANNRKKKREKEILKINLKSNCY